MEPYELQVIAPGQNGRADAALLLSASWEDRCTGVAERLHRDYRASQILVTVYDGVSRRREKNIARLDALLSSTGEIVKVPAAHVDPLGNVRSTVQILRSLNLEKDAPITIDITCYTRLHLLQLLQGLDRSSLLGNTRFLYTRPADYRTTDNEPISQGVRSVKAINTFTGSNRPSKDSLLIIFLSYEGRRAEALWDHLEPNQAILVIPHPPYHPSWRGRTEEQNRYLLSLVPGDRIMRSDASDPASTERLLSEITCDVRFSPERYNYRIAPLGTKAQVLGVYRFWRQKPRLPTLMYASPVAYRDDQPQYPAASVLCLDHSADWPRMPNHVTVSPPAG